YANGTNELKAKRIVQEMAPEVYVTASHEILPVWREFERFSTAVAERVLREADVSRARRKKKIDALAAQHILQGWLDARPTAGASS
ncbi:MAG: RuvX/YqgF family protein, partial [Deltaproteobacteria bacterium]|nr:RuvX/YqgF family protein [Deltaproteobacteria bacterium]